MARKAFRELRLMVASIVSSARNLLWVIMILCVLLYVFGISFTSAVALELEMSPPDAPGTAELVPRHDENPLISSIFDGLSSVFHRFFDGFGGRKPWKAVRSATSAP